MAVVLPALRLVVIVSNIWLSFKTLRPLPISRSHRNNGPSLRASATRKREMKACLSVWVIWACWSASEKLVDRTIGLFIPFYSDFKTLFLFVLLISRSIIAEPLLLRFLRPLLKPYTSTLDSTLELFTFFGDLLMYLISLPWAYLKGLMKRPSRVEVSEPASANQTSGEPQVALETPFNDQNQNEHSIAIVDQSSLVEPSLPDGARQVFEQSYVLDQTVYSKQGRSKQTHSTSRDHAAESGRPSGSRIVSDTAVSTRRRKGRLETDEEKDPTFRRPNSTRPPSRAEEARLYGWAGPITATNNSSRITNPSRHSKQSVDVSYYAIRNLNPSITLAPATDQPSPTNANISTLATAPLPVTAAPAPQHPSPIRTNSPKSPPVSLEAPPSSQKISPRIPPSPSIPGSFYTTPPVGLPSPVSSLQEVTSISSASSSLYSLEAPVEPVRPLSVAERGSRLLEMAAGGPSSNFHTSAREKNRTTAAAERANEQTRAPWRKRAGTTSRHGENNRLLEQPRIDPNAAASSASHNNIGGVKRPVSAATLARRNRIASASGVPKASTALASTAAPAALAQPEIVSVPASSSALPPGRKRSVSGHAKPSIRTPIAPTPEITPETHSSDSDAGTTASAKKKRRVEALRRLSDTNERDHLTVEDTLGAEASSTEQSDSELEEGGWSELDELKTPLHIARRKLLPAGLGRAPIPLPDSQPLSVPMPLMSAAVVESKASEEQLGPLRAQAPVFLDGDEEILPKEPRRRGLRSEDKVPPITATRVSTRNVAAAAAAARRRAAGLGVGVAIGSVAVSTTVANRGRAASRGRDQGQA